MNKREFLKKAAVLTSSVTLLPSAKWIIGKEGKVRTAHIGVSNMGGEDLRDISSHASVEVFALCDVNTIALAAAKKLHPNAKTYSDYRVMLKEMKGDIDAVIVSTPDHTHAPASLLAMEMGKSVYCQKPLTHHVSESRAMAKMAKEKNLVTQMGIQVHSFYDYVLTTHLIQSGIIGKVHTVRAWSPKNWGTNKKAPKGSDDVPANLDWNLWQGTAKERPYKDKVYTPMNWRKLMDYGCGTLGDMGVHIFDTPYNALQLDVPKTIVNDCREPNGFGYPSKNIVTYEFPGTPYTADTLKWIWYDGKGAPKKHDDLKLPGKEKLHDQGAMFMGEKGKLYLPHFMLLPKVIRNGEFVNIDNEIAAVEKTQKLGKPIRNYNSEGPKHYHQFIDACMGKADCSAPFSYAARLTETILLGVIAGRFPNQTLHWDSKKAKFQEEEANQFLSGDYRKF